MINLNTQVVFEKITKDLHLNADCFLKMVTLARILYERGHMTLRLSRMPILVLKVTKWQISEDFHDLKHVFGGFLTVMQHFGVTLPLDGWK